MFFQVCDLKVLDVVSQCLGSAHDSFIWSLSGLKHNLESRSFLHHVYLLVNSGYLLEAHLMIPFLNPSLSREYLFNVKHRKTHGAIERCFGVIKSRFRVLPKPCATVLYSTSKI
ncbi:putative nuclease HARBI1, partial [Stegodyphus mimosarum]